MTWSNAAAERCGTAHKAANTTPANINGFRI
jgi:hypothetical protein